MSGKLASLARSFCWAGQGVLHCVRGERNFRVHLTAAFYVALLAGMLRLSGLEMAVLAVTIGNVLVMELLNTAVEALVDLASPDVHPLAKVAKDVAAGAVLVSAAVSVAVGFFLLWKPGPLLALGARVLDEPPLLLLLALSCVCAYWFIFGLDRPKK